MTIHETLLLFTGIRSFWERNRSFLPKCLFIKDGPLAIRAQYSKLVNPIRRFLAHAQSQGINVNILGQEKSGYFFDHLEIIEKEAPVKSFFIPQDHYIKEEIQLRPDIGQAYGYYTNYGAKLFVKYDEYVKMVLNVPTGPFKPNVPHEDLIGADNILATIPTLISSKYEDALFPISLVHDIASLSTYPSGHILKIIAEAKGIG